MHWCPAAWGALLQQGPFCSYSNLHYDAGLFPCALQCCKRYNLDGINQEANVSLGVHGSKVSGICGLIA